MSGRYRHEITLQTRTETLDSHGEATLSYTTLATVWAQVVAVSARERLQNQQISADVTDRMTFAYASEYAGLTPADRVLVGSRTFDIVHVLDRQGKNREIEITARERI